MQHYSPHSGHDLLPLLSLKHTHSLPVVAWMRMAPINSCIWILVFSWWNCLERIRRWDLVEQGVSPGMDFEVSKPHAILISLSPACGSRCTFSATALVLYLTACLLLCSPSWWFWTPTLCKGKSQIKCFFLKVALAMLCYLTETGWSLRSRM